MQKQQYEVHPVANLFPMMTESELSKLKKDILKNGQLEMIAFWNGMLIDGRNRMRACEELGIEPETADLPEEEDPFQYVLTKNLHRRQLHPNQRAMVAAKMANLKNGQHKATQICGALSQEDAALLLDITLRQLQQAKFILDHGSQALIDAVESRAITSINKAVKLCKACEDKREQTRLVKEGSKAIDDYLNPTPFESVEPSDSSSGDEADDYDYQVVKSFKLADYRLNTLKRIIESLEPHEVALLKGWVGV
jgi:ParB-like chromosome segregation protein Spo0J